MRLSPRHLQETWPALLNQWRLSGNTQFDPLQYFNPQNANDAFLELWAFEYFVTRLKWLEREDRFGPSPLVNGHDNQNPLYYLYNEAKEALRNAGANPWSQGQYIQLLDAILFTALDLFERICTRLLARDQYGRVGYRQGLYKEVIEMARLFAPILSQFHPFDMYLLLTWLDEMTGSGMDPDILRRVTDQIGYQDQYYIRLLAQQDALNGSAVGLRIFRVLQ
jgi:hypothetical protein